MMTKPLIPSGTPIRPKRILLFEQMRAEGYFVGSRAHCYRLMAAGKFPLPVKVGRRIGWFQDDVRRWQEGLEVASELGGRQ